MKNDIIVLVFALKHYIYYETARVSIIDNGATVESVISQNPLLKELYSSIALNLLTLVEKEAIT